MPFLESEENDIVREKMIELCDSKADTVFPISAKHGTGLEMLTDQIRNVIRELEKESDEEGI